MLPWSQSIKPAPIPPNAPSFADDRHTLPEGSEIDGLVARRPIEDEVDWVIIGSGAAGAAAAVTLAEAGQSVAIIEEGPWIRTREFQKDLYPAMKQLWRGMATHVTRGRALIPVMQGRCVGGSTTINSAIAWRTPSDVLADWGSRWDLAPEITEKALDPEFAWLERELLVRPVADHALGENSATFALGAQRMGFESHVIQRYDAGCEGSASCGHGCRSAKKQAMNITFVPRTLHAGGKIYHSSTVERIESRGQRAVAVIAQMRGINGPHTLRVRARKGILVAASTVQSPNILRRSGIRSRHLGEHFQGHPGVSVAARFERDVKMDYGSTQGYNSLHFLKEKGIKLESLMLPPELAVARLPGLGPELMERFADYSKIAVSAVVIKSEAEGSVREGIGQDSVRYDLTRRDMERCREALRATTELLFAAGAVEVYPGVHGMPTILKSADEAQKWDTAPLDTRAYTMIVSHMFGATRMSKNPNAGVVDATFKTHECDGLYVVDSGVFPTNLGINPQHTIMAMARLCANRLLQ
jgi:choline dehydrogenase-like flavoprotein